MISRFAFAYLVVIWCFIWYFAERSWKSIKHDYKNNSGGNLEVSSNFSTKISIAITSYSSCCWRKPFCYKHNTMLIDKVVLRIKISSIETVYFGQGWANQRNVCRSWSSRWSCRSLCGDSRLVLRSYEVCIVSQTPKRKNDWIERKSLGM